MLRRRVAKQMEGETSDCEASFMRLATRLFQRGKYAKERYNDGSMWGMSTEGQYLEFACDEMLRTTGGLFDVAMLVGELFFAIQCCKFSHGNEECVGRLVELITKMPMTEDQDDMQYRRVAYCCCGGTICQRRRTQIWLEMDRRGLCHTPNYSVISNGAWVQFMDSFYRGNQAVRAIKDKEQWLLHREEQKRECIEEEGHGGTCAHDTRNAARSAGSDLDSNVGAYAGWGNLAYSDSEESDMERDWDTCDDSDSEIGADNTDEAEGECCEAHDGMSAEGGDAPDDGWGDSAYSDGEESDMEDRDWDIGDDSDSDFGGDNTDEAGGECCEAYDGMSAEGGDAPDDGWGNSAYSDGEESDKEDRDWDICDDSDSEIGGNEAHDGMSAEVGEAPDDGRGNPAYSDGEEAECRWALVVAAWHDSTTAGGGGGYDGRLDDTGCGNGEGGGGNETGVRDELWRGCGGGGGRLVVWEKGVRAKKERLAIRSLGQWGTWAVACGTGERWEEGKPVMRDRILGGWWVWERGRKCGGGRRGAGAEESVMKHSHDVLPRSRGGAAATEEEQERGNFDKSGRGGRVRSTRKTTACLGKAGGRAVTLAVAEAFI